MLVYELIYNNSNGLAVATEYTPEEPEDLKNPKYFYTDYVELLKDVEVSKKIKVGTPIVFTGKIGNVEYQSKVTSYGRLRISKILDADLDKIGILSNEYERISAKSAAKLSLYLNQFEDGIEKRKELTKFALRVVTMAGVVTFDYTTLYATSSPETYKKIRNIADSKDLNDKQKLLLLTEEFKKYQKEIENSFSDDLKDELKRANRVKLNSIVDMTASQLIVSGVDEKPVITRGSLLSGYTEKDYRLHAIENRSE